MEKIEKSSKNKVGKVWEIKKTIIGGKKAAQEATAILNPTTGKLAVSKKEIKEVSLKYCIETLANNKPEEGFEEEINRKKKLVQDLLKLKGGNFEASIDTYRKMIDKFKRSKKRNYDFLTKAGKEFQEMVFKFCQKMFEKEEFPRDFQDTTLHMIFQGGIGKKRESLDANRFIHSKGFFARAAEGLIVEDASRLRSWLPPPSSRSAASPATGRRK